MKRDTVRSLGSILIWVGAIAIVASFLTKMIFHYDTLAPYSPYFFACLLTGIGMMAITRI